MKDDFANADQEAQLLESQVLPVISYNPDHDIASSPKDILDLRERLLKKYHNGVLSLVEKLKIKSGSEETKYDDLIKELVDEVIAETDALKGNELVSEHHGNLRDASIIAFKRAEVLEKAINAVQTKQEFERDRSIDLDSPYMKIIFKYFMHKTKTVLSKMGYSDDANDVFFKNLFDEMKDWQKELKAEIAESVDKK